jgi:hypothetical protein
MDESDNDKKPTPMIEGELITISTGCYSDYDVEGVFRVKKSFDAVEVLKHWEGDRDSYDSCKRFLGYLASQGYIEDVPSRELHLGNYDLDDNFGIYGGES